MLKSFRRRVIPFLLVLLALGLSVASCFAEDNPQAAAGKAADDKSQVIRVAIMPFKNLSSTNDSVAENLAYGMAEALITGLSYANNVTIIERSQVDKLLDEQGLAKAGFTDAKTSADVGKLLGAGKVIIGSYQVVGGQIRIDARIVDVNTGEVDKTKAFMVKGRWTDDIFDLQEEIAEKFVSSFNGKVTEQEKSKISNVMDATKNYGAYDLYVRGRSEEFKFTLEGYQQAINYFNQAVEMDPNFALAWAEMATAYCYLDNLMAYQGKVLPRPTGQIMNSAKRAMAANPNIAESHMALARAYGYLGREKDSLEEIKWAATLKPNDPEIYSLWAGLTRAYATPLFLQAKSLDPKNYQVLVDYACQLFYEGEYEDALSEMLAAIQVNPKSHYAYAGVADCYYMLGNYPEAEKYWKKALEFDPNLAHSYMMLGKLYQANGKTADAQAMYKKAVEINSLWQTVLDLEDAVAKEPNKISNYISLAQNYTWVNETWFAVRTIERALAVSNAPELYYNYGNYQYLLRLGVKAAIAWATYATTVDTSDAKNYADIERASKCLDFLNIDNLDLPKTAPSHGGNTAWSDDFADDRNHWADTVNVAQVYQGALFVDTTNYNGYDLPLLPQNGSTMLDNYSVEADVAWVGGEQNAPMGLVFGWDSWSYYYIFEVAASGYYSVVQWNNDHYVDIIPWTKTGAVYTDNHYNKLKITATQQGYDLSINGRKVDSINDRSQKLGLFGIYAGANIQTYFDNLKAY